MSNPPVTLRDLVVHQLIKEANGPASVALRDAVLPVTPAGQRLVDHLCQQYVARLGKGFGKFEEDETQFAVPLLGERLDAVTVGFGLAVIAVVFIGKRMPVH